MAVDTPTVACEAELPPEMPADAAKSVLFRLRAAFNSQGRYCYPEPGRPGPDWPWAPEWWKPSSYRRNLIKAGALIIAEIERLDRAAPPSTEIEGC